MFMTKLFILFCLISSGSSDTASINQAEEVCCELTGCFNDEPPFNRMPLPMCTDPIENTPSYNLYTRENSDTPYPITPTHLPWNFSKSKPTYFIAHGYTANGGVSWVIRMKNTLLAKEDANVVAVDWKELAGQSIYPKSASNTRTVGAHTALVMKNIRENKEKAYLWCIGHSLGSHLCAHAGAKIRVDRITGMDPAGVEFETIPDLTVGLNPKSADFVDVMHTDKAAGNTRPLGHLDFYPNGGDKQPGCITNSCSHSVVCEFFIESIKQDCFLATKKCADHTDIPNDSCEECDGCALMGYGAGQSKVKSGIIYLTTQKDVPYCLSPSA